MKLKNSYILLIAMAIFLLVSIGSVCASENVTTDSDSPLASADAESIIAEGETSSGDATQEKINTTVVASDSEIDYDADKNIDVTVKDNESQTIDVNESDFKVLEGTKSLNFTYNNSIVSIKDNLTVGNHSIIINYLGNSKYANSTTTIILSVLGNKTLEAPANIVKTGDKFEIKDVKVFNGAKYIELVQENFKLNITYIDDEGNLTSVNVTDFTYENGTITFNYDKVVRSITLNYTDAVNTKTIGVKYGSSVNASDAKIRDTEDKNITVNVYDNENKELTITKNDLKVLENGKAVTFDYNNSIITVKNLAIGTHTLTIVYNGNSTFVSSNKTITLKIWGNETFNPDKDAVIDSQNDVNITLNLSDGADLVNVTKENLNVTLFYTVGNQTYNKTIDEITLAEDMQTISFKVDETFDSAYVNITYAAKENNLTAITTLRVNSTINSEDVISKGDNEVINITASVVGSDGKTLNVTSANIEVYQGSKKLNVTYDNSVITINDKLTLGVYTLTVKFKGNDTYADATKDITLNVYGIKADSKIDVNSSKIGNVKFNITDGNATLNITKDNVTINVTYKDGNDTKVITVTEWKIENGTLIFTLENGNFTTATLTISSNITTPFNVTLNRIYNIGIIPINVTEDYQGNDFAFKVVDIDDNNAPLANKTITVSGKQGDAGLYWQKWNGYSVEYASASKSLKTDANGIAILPNNEFYPGFAISDYVFPSAGEYVMTVTGSGNLKGSPKFNLTVNKINLKVEIVNFNEYYGTTEKFTILVTNEKTGKPVYGVPVYFKVVNSEGKEITYSTSSGTKINASLTDINGTVKLPATNLPTDTYTISANTTNSTNYNASTGSGQANIKKIPVVINGNDVTIYYNSGTTYTLKVTKDGKGVEGVYVFVRLYTTSKKFKDFIFLTDKNGQVSFESYLLGVTLEVGKHKVIVALADARYEANQITKTIKVKKATAKIKAKKVTVYYNDGYLTVKVTNTKNNKPIANATVNIKIFISKNKYYNYKGRTGANGKLKLLLAGLKPGKYKVVIEGADSKNFEAKQITTKVIIKKAPTKLVAKKLKAKKGAKKYFKVTAKNKKTKKGIAGIKLKIKVYTGKKYKTFTKKTNSKGVAKISTKSLKVGKHKVVVSSANKYCKAKKAKSSIKITK